MTAEFSGDAAPADPPPEVANDDAFTRLEKEMTAMKNAIGGFHTKLPTPRATSGPSRKTKPSEA